MRLKVCLFWQMVNPQESRVSEREGLGINEGIIV